MLPVGLVTVTWFTGVTMPKKNSITASSTGKPTKPTPDFPLFPHATGRWAKKIKGRLVYFGPWSDPQAALEKYDQQKDDLHAGRKPKHDDPDHGTIKELCNGFLRAKRSMVDSGELTERSWQDYKAATDLIVAHFGKWRLLTDLDIDDFAKLRNKMAKKWGPVTLGNTIQRIRVVFKYAFDAGLIDRPIRYGPGFKRPSKKTIRIDRAKKGAKLFTADEIRRLLGWPPWREAAGIHLHAMILLGINCGFGNADCGTLPLTALDLDAGWVNFPRPKTGIPRRCPLWPETVQAIRESLAHRPDPRDEKHAGLLFVTKYGLPWAKDTADQTLAKEFGKLLRKLQIGARAGLGFYTLRHVFRTVADEVKDQPACDLAMGHESPHMSSVYRERISDERLKVVTDHVRAWLMLVKPPV